MGLVDINRLWRERYRAESDVQEIEIREVDIKEFKIEEIRIEEIKSKERNNTDNNNRPSLIPMRLLLLALFAIIETAGTTDDLRLLYQSSRVATADSKTLQLAALTALANYSIARLLDAANMHKSFLTLLLYTIEGLQWG